MKYRDPRNILQLEDLSGRELQLVKGGCGKEEDNQDGKVDQKGPIED